jgi:hypothetical protein
MIPRWCSRFVAALAVGLAACGSGDPEPRRESAAPPASTPPPVAQPAQNPATLPEPVPTAGQSRRREATKVAYAGELPPLPVTNFPAARPPEVVKAVYEFAARRPDVLRYVPCFCGCERNGHVHNEHCFVASREADGKPRWDAHGMS